MSDRFSNTTELPIPDENAYRRASGGQANPSQGQPRQQNPNSQNGARRSDVRNVNRQRVNPEQRTLQHPQRTVNRDARQRLGPPPEDTRPTMQVRRASYQTQLPPDDQSEPTRTVGGRPTYQRPEFAERPPKPSTAKTRDEQKSAKKKHKRKKKSCLRRIVTAVLIFILSLFAIYSCIALLAIKQLKYEQTETRNLIVGAAEADPSVKNILLIGTDNRTETDRGRADTMILLSFSSHNNTMTMTSLMRDSYVTIPNHGNDKLNAAYAYGGATLLMDTIANNFGIRVDDYICVNFKSFVHIADAVGGLKVTVSDREAEAINVILESEVNAIMGDDPKADFLPSGGTFVLNGKQALAYARIRYVGNADFERTERQREVLDLMLDKIKHLKPTSIPSILVKALPELSTNMTTGKLYLKSFELPVKLLYYDMQQLRIPADGTFANQTAPNGQMVLTVDFDKNMQNYLKAVNDPVVKPAETAPANQGGAA